MSQIVTDFALVFETTRGSPPRGLGANVATYCTDVDDTRKPCVGLYIDLSPLDDVAKHEPHLGMFMSPGEARKLADTLLKAATRCEAQMKREAEVT